MSVGIPDFLSTEAKEFVITLKLAVIEKFRLEINRTSPSS
jgi:hypothetical protein